MARHKKQQLTKKRRAVYAALVSLVIIFIAGGVWFFVKDEATRVSEDEEIYKTLDEQASRTARSSVAAEGGSTEEVQKLYEKSIEQVSSSQKADLYLELATSLLSANVPSQDQKKQALDAALKAEELSPTPATAAMLVSCYRLLGDEQNAAKYEQLAAQRAERAPVEEGGGR